jgi:uncharacterized protein
MRPGAESIYRRAMSETHAVPALLSVARGPVRASERALAPDLARGVMLLLIVVSNTGFHLFAARYGQGWHPIDGSTADRVVQFVVITTLDMKVYPLFSFLLGYGMMQLYLRQTAAGTPERDVGRILRRRSLWLIVFGFIHATMLLASEILTFYGVVTLVLGWLFIRRGTRTLVIACTVATLLSVALAAPELIAIARGDFGSADIVVTESPIVALATGEPDVFAAVGRRFMTWLFLLGAGAIGWIASPQILIGFWAARQRILEEPEKHRRLLWWTAVLGITTGWLGGLPSALAHIGVLNVPLAAISEEGRLTALRDLTGVFGGLGYVAVFGLVAIRLSGRARQNRAVVAMCAVGKRSLSSYLAHSLIFAPILAAWGLGLGAKLGSATMALFAVGVWLVTVVAAYTLERSGRAGPAETLLRHLIYRHKQTAT